MAHAALLIVIYLDREGAVIWIIAGLVSCFLAAVIVGAALVIRRS